MTGSSLDRPAERDTLYFVDKAIRKAMTIIFHPDPGTVLICDFSGFKAPEMVKRRPVIVISPRFRERDNLCTVVPLSTTAPAKLCEYHCRIRMEPPLPAPYTDTVMWVKADMLCSVSFDRLSLPFVGKDSDGKRVYDVRHVTEVELKDIQACVLHGIGLGRLTTGL